MKVCDGCHFENDPDAKFCARCNVALFYTGGYSLKEVYANPDSPIDTENKICAACQTIDLSSTTKCKKCGSRAMFVKLRQDGSFNWNPELEPHYKVKKYTENVLGCGCLTVIGVVLYLLLSSCVGAVLHPSSPSGPSCHDRISQEYVNNQLTDGEYLSKLNSECGEHN